VATAHRGVPGSRELVRARDEKVQVYGRGRVCSHASCATVLSAYNPSAYCYLHERSRVDDAISRRQTQRLAVARACAFEGCGQPFTSANPARLYCSDRCRMAAFQKRRTRDRRARRAQRACGAPGPA
jgi:hypothetical protein